MAKTLERLQHTRSRLTIAAWTALRVGVGIVMAAHGLQKLGDTAGWQQQVAALGVPLPEVAAWLALGAELFGGIALAIGLLTPLAAIAIGCVMLTAIFTVHYGHGLMAAQGGFEMPLVILLVAIYFVFRGAGPLSLDAVVFSRVRNRRSRRAAMGPEPGFRAPAPA